MKKSNNFIKKLQNKPEKTKRLILWTIMSIAGLVVAIVWIIIISNILGNVKKDDVSDQLNLPVLESEMEKIPKIELPEGFEEDLKKLEEEIKKIEEAEKQGKLKNEETEQSLKK